MTIGVAIFEPEIAAVAPAEFAQPLPERLVPRLGLRARERRQQTDHPNILLLREGGQRQCKGRPAQRADQRPPVHSMTSSACASSNCGTVRPSAFAVVRLITSRKRVGN